jgi:putative acetyltransferase
MDHRREASQTAPVIIRRERPADHDAVRALHRAAFAVDPVTGTLRAEDDVPEAWLVDELREDVGFLPHLSLVAVGGDAVVGHVLATRGWIEPLGVPVLGLGPLGVVPDHQRAGVGSALVHALVAVAEARDERLVALLGAPGYYGRFGFARSTDLGIAPPDPGWGEFFQARRLSGSPIQGTFRYADAFGRMSGLSDAGPGAG